MKKNYLFLLSLTFFAVSAQNRTYGDAALQAENQHQSYSRASLLGEGCNTVVINDTEEENGVFIIGA